MIDIDRLVENIVARIIAEQQSKREKIIVSGATPVRAKKTTTKGLDRKDFSMSKGEVEDLLLVKGSSGVLNNLVIKANSNNFELNVISDDAVVYSGSFNDYDEISELTEGMDAYLDTNGKYNIAITGVKFSYFLHVYIVALDSVTFDRIYINYEVG